MVDLFRPLDLPRGKTKVLDLGCGKGAVAVHLARDLGFRVTGIDLFPPFIDAARKRAEEEGVGGLCRFFRGDIREKVKRPGRFDAAILISTGQALGSLEAAVSGLRNKVLPGGLMAVADGFRKGGPEADRALEGHPTREEALAMLASRGDVILTERQVPPDLTTRNYRKYLDSLRQGSARIRQKSPGLETRLREHLAAQERSCETLEAFFVPTLWLMRKTEGS